MKTKYHSPNGLLSLLVALLLTVLFPAAALAAGGDTVTVAYIDYSHFVENSEDGSYTGYGADYLNRIAAYTGWRYDFVDMDWPTAYEAVKTGTVDFYCVARWTEQREQDFDFSLYPICNEEMNLYTLPDSGLYYEDFGAFNGMNIGMLENSAEIESFSQYALTNGFSYTLTEYPMNEEAVAALTRGEVDAVALVNYSVDGNFKLIGNFGVSPAYLMSCNGSAYMEEFSEAQEHLYFDDPHFAENLEQVYYGELRSASALLLTQEEAAYIASADTLNVAISPDMAPVEYYDEGSGAFRGVTIDLMKRITDMTGLQFNFVRRESKDALLGQMARGEVQLLGALARDRQVEKTLGVVQTASFSESSFSLVTKDLNALTPDSVAAVPAGYPMFQYAALENGYGKCREYATFDACIRAVYAGEADLTYVITLCEDYLLDHVQYAGLRSMALGGTEYSICLGVVDQGDNALLVSIINKCIKAISGNEINAMIVANTAAATPRQTVSDWLARNGIFMLIIAVVIVAAGVLLFLRAQKTKQQKKLNATLQQQHDFLRHLYDTVPCGIFQYEYEAPHRIINCNAAVRKIYGYDSDCFLIGKTPDAVVKEDTKDDFLEKFRLCEQTGAPVSYVWPITKSDGTMAYTECIMDIVTTEQGRVFQEVFIDVTEREANARMVEKRYMQELNRNEKRGDDMLYTICFDIDEQLITQTNLNLPGVQTGITVDAFLLRSRPPFLNTKRRKSSKRSERGSLQKTWQTPMRRAGPSIVFSSAVKQKRRLNGCAATSRCGTTPKPGTWCALLISRTSPTSTLRKRSCATWRFPTATAS